MMNTVERYALRVKIAMFGYCVVSDFFSSSDG